MVNESDIISWQCCECKAMNSGSRAEIEKAIAGKIKTFLICSYCGLGNDPQTISPQESVSEASWLQCIPFQGSERKDTPIGSIKRGDETIWLDQDEKQLSRMEFILKHGRDPQIWWDKYRKK